MMALMDEYHGYILTREHYEAGGRHMLRFTGAGETGPFEVVITGDRPVFFIRREAKLPGHVRFDQRRPVALATFDKVPVDALYFRTLSAFFTARKQLEDLGITTFESDVQPEDRFLMERFINGNVVIKGSGRQWNGMFRFKDPVVRPGDFSPSFSVMSLDIETGQNGALYSIACHVESKDQDPVGIVLIHDPRVRTNDSCGAGLPVDIRFAKARVIPLDPEGWMVSLPGEADLLTGFNQIMAALDPDIIIGWHVVGFDLEFLRQKYQDHGIRFALGRDRRTPRIRQVQKGTWAADVSGRVVIDGPPTLRGAFYSFDNFRLDTVAKEILGTGKDITGDTGKVAEIERRFRQDKHALARYNLLDCTLVSEIFEKTGLIDLTWKRAQLSGLAMDGVGRSVAAFDHFMLPMIHRNGLVAPNIRDIRDVGHAKGGWVFTKSPGFFEHIAVFDFKSLYPSIIRTFKIDPLSRLMADQHPLSTPVATRFSRDRHVLPDFITRLMDTRAGAKGQGDTHLSQAVKILMNSFYGVMGTPKSRFYNPDLSRSITGTGRWMLKTARKFLEGMGYKVLYGDTDSVFVQLKPHECERGDHHALELAHTINDYLTSIIKDKFDLTSHLEIEFEKRFVRFFLPALRGGGNSAKKRYAGLIDDGGKGQLVFTGLEFVRSDWTRFARQFQYDLFERIFNDQPVESWIRDTVMAVKTGRHDRDLVYKKRLTKPLVEYVKLVPPHVKAARMLKEKNDTLREIYYVMTLRGPVPTDLPHDDLDYGHYIDKQLRPIADAVLLFFDTSVAEIMGGKQLSLF